MSLHMDMGSTKENNSPNIRGLDLRDKDEALRIKDE